MLYPKTPPWGANHRVAQVSSSDGPPGQPLTNGPVWETGLAGKAQRLCQLRIVSLNPLIPTQYTSHPPHRLEDEIMKNLPQPGTFCTRFTNTVTYGVRTLLARLPPFYSARLSLRTTFSLSGKAFLPKKRQQAAALQIGPNTQPWKSEPQHISPRFSDLRSLFHSWFLEIRTFLL